MNARWVPVLLGIICAVLLVAALYLADVIFAPVACALFIIAIVWPLQARLQAQLLALAIVVALVVLAFFVFASVVAWSFNRIGRTLIAETPRLQGLYEQVTTWLEMHGIVVAGLWAEHFNVRWVVGAMQGLSARLNTMISFWIVVLIYVLLGLLEVGPLARKIPNLVSADAARVLIVGGARTAAKLRRYLMIRTVMSIATGGLVYVGQLHRTACCRKRIGYASLPCAVLGLSVDVPLGSVRRLHRRSDSNRRVDPLRPITLDQLAFPVVGRA